VCGCYGKGGASPTPGGADLHEPEVFVSITIGIFDDATEAQDAIDRLVREGVEDRGLHPISRQRVERVRSGLRGPHPHAVGSAKGAVSSELTSLGVDAKEAEFYDEELEDGAVLLAVEAGDAHDEVVQSIMREANATLRKR